MTSEILRSEGAKLTLHLDGPTWEGVPSATLGAFNCTTPEAGADLLRRAIARTRSAERQRLLAPMDGDTWHSYRFVIETDGSAPFLLEPPDRPVARTALLGAGFDEVSRYFSARVPLAETARSAPPESTDFVVTQWDGEAPQALFEQVFDLSKQAFAENAFYKPISREAFLALYMPMVPLLKRELIFFARRSDGALAGFLFGTPNYAEGPAPHTAILKTYASLIKGAGQHLAHAFHQAALEAGYDTAIHALIHDSNLSALRSATEGGQVFRRYALYGLRLDG
ncbi:MAG: hypothetical protein AAGB05_13285 [Pseudomonadota bacterium]